MNALRDCGLSEDRARRPGSAARKAMTALALHHHPDGWEIRRYGAAAIAIVLLHVALIAAGASLVPARRACRRQPSRHPRRPLPPAPAAPQIQTEDTGVGPVTSGGRGAAARTAEDGDDRAVAANAAAGEAGRRGAAEGRTEAGAGTRQAAARQGCEEADQEAAGGSTPGRPRPTGLRRNRLRRHRARALRPPLQHRIARCLSRTCSASSNIQAAQRRARTDQPVSFTMTRSGRVTGSRLAKSSGNAALDQAALALDPACAADAILPAGDARGVGDLHGAVQLQASRLIAGRPLDGRLQVVIRRAWIRTRRASSIATRALYCRYCSPKVATRSRSSSAMPMKMCGRRHGSEQQVADRHHRRRPEGDDEAEIQRVTDMAIEARRRKAHLRRGAADEIHRHLLQPEQLEVADQECAVDHQQPTYHRHQLDHESQRQIVDAPDDRVDRLPERKQAQSARGWSTAHRSNARAPATPGRSARA